MNLPDAAVEAGAKAIASANAYLSATGNAVPSVLARAVLGAASREITCPDCVDGLTLREGTPWPIRKALGVPNDSEMVPCDLCGGTSTLFVLIAGSPDG